MAQARLAIEYARIGRLDAAKAHHARAGSLAHHPRLASELALALAAAGDLAAGRALLAELERRNPGDPQLALARRSLAERRAPFDESATPPAARNESSRKEGT
jgi:hypothetical protein